MEITQEITGLDNNNRKVGSHTKIWSSAHHLLRVRIFHIDPRFCTAKFVSKLGIAQEIPAPASVGAGYFRVHFIFVIIDVV